MTKENKTVELWDGFEVPVDKQLLDDMDFASDLSSALNQNNMEDLVTMYMALVGGEETYEKVRTHIEEEHGYFSQKAFLEIIDKINAVFPKSGNRAQRRSWKTSR